MVAREEDEEGEKRCARQILDLVEGGWGLSLVYVGVQQVVVVEIWCTVGRALRIGNMMNECECWR